MSRPKVLVLLAAYNGADWIGQQIDTILSQTGVDVDLLISNDWSTDNTEIEIATYVEKRQARTISPPSRTGSAAQNFLWMIRGNSGEAYDFIALADQDDLWLDGKLHRGCTLLADRHADGYSCAVTAFWPNGRSAVHAQVARPTSGDFLFEGAGQGCTFILSTKFYAQIRAFLSMHIVESQALRFHDWAIYALSRCWELQWLFDPRPMLRYRQHASNDTGARWSVNGLSRRVELIRRGWYRQQLEIIATLCLRASQENREIQRWSSVLAMPTGIKRRLAAIAFCLKNGRRRVIDRTIVVIAAGIGWI